MNFLPIFHVRTQEHGHRQQISNYGNDELNREERLKIIIKIVLMNNFRIVILTKILVNNYTFINRNRYQSELIFVEK